MSNNRDDESPSFLDGLFDALRQATETDDTVKSDRVSGKRGRIEYGYTVKTGLGPGSAGRKGHPSFDASRRPSGPSKGSPERTPRVDRIGDDCRVIADISDTAATPASAVTVRIAADTLCIIADGDTVATAELPDDGPWTVQTTSVNNGVFQATVTSE